MTTRMEKYYQNNTDSPSRTAKNSNLYDEIYDNVKYTNVEGISKIEKTNEIDLARIKEFIKEHEEQKNRDYRMIKKIVLEPIPEEEVDLEQYDLKQIINAAKKERPKEEKERYVQSVKYKVVTDKLNKIADGEEIKLDDLTNTKDLSELGDYELSLDLLDNFKEDVEETFTETEKEEQDSEDMDDSFYTSSMHFSREDFEELEDINKDLKKNNIWITILVFVLLVIVITGCLFLFNHIL